MQANLDLTNGSTGETLAEASLSAQHWLSTLATHEEFMAKLELAFGQLFDTNKAENLRQQWQENNFESLPAIVIRSKAELRGAKGAFSQDTNKIYLTQEYLDNNISNPQAITNILLEEIGHFIDAQINPSDAAGDEGAIFSTIAQNQPLSETKLNALKAENDTITVTLDGQTLEIERATEGIREILKNSIQFVLDKAESIAENIQDADLPLLGDKVQELGEKAIEEIEKFRNEIDEKIDKLEDETEEDIRDFILDELGEDGLDILRDLDGDNDVDKDDVKISLDPNDCNFQFNIGAFSDFSLDIAGSDLGLPGLGFTLNQGTAELGLDYQLNLNFGADRINDDLRFYFDTSGEDEIQIDLQLLDLDFPDEIITAELGFLDLNIQDNGTQFLDTKLFLDIEDNPDDSDTFLRLGETPSVDSKFEGEVNLDLHLETSFDGSRTLPSISSDFELDWSFGENNNNPKEPENFGNTPTIAFNNVQIDLGTFFSDFANPILKSVQEITKPIEPIAKFLTRTIQFTEGQSTAFEEFAFSTLFGTDVDLEFLIQILNLVNLVNNIPTDSNIMLELGSFNLLENDPRKKDFDLSSVNPNITKIASPLETQLAGTKEGESIQTAQDETGDRIKFPIIKDPDTAFSLLLGKDNVDLFTYKLPDLNINLKKSYPLVVIPLSGVFFASAGLDVGLNANSDVEFGFDTFGLNQYQETDDIDDIFNGFFIKDNGDQPLVTAGFSVAAFAEIGVGIDGVANITGGLMGGPKGNISLDLIDPNNSGKVRKDELISIFSASPLELFELNGSVDFVVDAFIKGELFGTEKIFEEANLITEELLSFTVDFRDGQEKDSQSPFLATNLGFENFDNDGILRLNIGENANLRQDGFGDISEVYIIKHEAFSESNETVLVSSLGVVQDYKSIKKIVGNAGQGDDVIELADRDVLVPAELAGGPGNDSLTGGNNADTLTGGTGDDFLMGSAGGDIHDGGDGIDTASYRNSPEGVFHDLNTGAATGDAIGDVIFDSIEEIEGSPFDDEFIDTELDRFLLGRAGNDTLIGNDGNDSLNGGEDNDFLDGGNGNDTLLGETGEDTLIGGIGEDLLNGGEDDDLLNGGENDDTLLGEAGNDTLYGELGADSLRGGDGDDLLNGQDDSDTLFGEAGNDTLYGEQAGDFLSGGLGNDLLDSGSGNDTLFGGDLNDTLLGGDHQDYLDGEKGHDDLNGGAGQDTLIGGYGRDTLTGGLGNDLLQGGAARDILDGGADDDTLYGGDSTDLLLGQDGDDVLYGGEWNDFLSGGNGNDLMFGEESNDILHGDDGADTLDGGEGIDSLEGGKGNDLLLGGDEDDSLDGGVGNDTLDGGVGDDALVGGFGDDILTGGQGSDRFIYQQIEDGGDLIQDFTLDQDKIVLTELFNNSGINVLDLQGAVDLGHLGFSSNSGGVDLLFSASGNAADFTVLATVENLSAGALNQVDNFVL